LVFPIDLVFAGVLLNVKANVIEVIKGWFDFLGEGV
jgi:hypothetical protein